MLHTLASHMNDILSNFYNSSIAANQTACALITEVRQDFMHNDHSSKEHYDTNTT